VLPPPLVVPVRPQRPPPPATVAADAPGTAAPLPYGMRLTFGPGRAELNPRTYAALQAVLAAARPGTDFTVRAYAAGDPHDPSVARRLSLARALAVRSVLIHGGIASARISVLALGAAPPGAAPDRVDVSETQAP
ncbi:MAG: OmpA family protein, partial [Rhodospirillales bacterium]|nr:OmpA family protein [Rhodospirillales bacterium]